MIDRDVQHATPNSVMMGRRHLAEYLDVSIRTIDRLDAAGKLPLALRIGGAKRWPRDVIEDWIRLGCPHRREDVEHDRW